MVPGTPQNDTFLGGALPSRRGLPYVTRGRPLGVSLRRSRPQVLARPVVLGDTLGQSPGLLTGQFLVSCVVSSVSPDGTRPAAHPTGRAIATLILEESEWQGHLRTLRVRGDLLGTSPQRDVSP